MSRAVSDLRLPPREPHNHRHRAGRPRGTDGSWNTMLDRHYHRPAPTPTGLLL